MNRRQVGTNLAVALVVSYNSWVTAPWLSPNPRALLGYLSELAAQDQPAHLFYRVADSGAALLLLGIAALCWHGLQPWLGRGARWTAGALALVAVATIADAIFAMPCAVTLDEACKAAYAANPFGLDHFPHVVASVTVGAAMVLSVVFPLLSRWRQGDKRQTIWLAGFGCLLGAALLGSVAFEVTVGLGQGVVQAGQVALASGWFAYLAQRATRDTNRQGAACMKK